MTVSSDWQVEYGSLLIDGDVYALASVPAGLIGGVELRSSDRPRVARNGMVAGTVYTSGRTVTLQVEVASPTDAVAFASAMEDLTAAFALGQAEAALTFQIPGVAGGNPARVYARPNRGPSAAVDLTYYHRLPIVMVELFCTDPLIYDEDEIEATLAVAASAGGITWDLTWDAVWAGAGDASIVVTNEGTATTYPVIRLNGPLTDPAVTNVTTGRTVGFDLAIASGDYIDLDMAQRTALLNGTASRYSSLDQVEWWGLEPGGNQVRLTASLGAGTATLTARSAWS